VKFVGPAIILVFFVALSIRRYLMPKRGPAMAAFAKRHGLKYSPGGSSDMRRYDFPLFKKGVERGLENRMWGEWHGLPVRGGDYWFYKESLDDQGHTSRSYTYFSLALADLECTVPFVSIARENLLTKVSKRVGSNDIDFESGEFNRQFVVKSEDREFAFKLIDAEMMQYLLDTPGRFVIEVHGSNLLVHCDPLDPTKLASLFDAAKGVRDHIPRVVWTEYGSGPPA
jgi:hypothetical protein